ncbi:MAG: hypothetical protein UH788_07550 [Treponemataceae bacterium]|nr:hypothetical protein [Treponemataceae bacterium]
MEKSRKKRRITKSYGLLIFVVLFLLNTNSLFAHRYSYAVFTPVEEYVFAGEDTAFETVIYNMRPADVLVTVQTLPESVTFVSSDKTEILDENGRSTKIRIVLHFNEIGNFNLPPIASRIRYGSYRLSIKPVTVLHNPKTIQPIIKFSVIEPQDKIYYEGQRIKLQLSAIFASNVYSYTTSLNEDSVFYAKKDIATLPFSVEKFSDTEYPISELEFIPLSSGKIQVPQVSVRVRTWNGIEKESISEPLVLNVKKAVKSETVENFSKTVETSAISKIDSSEKVLKDVDSFDFSKNKELIEKIKELRIKEKNKFFPFSIIKERKEIERQCDLKNTQNELSNVVFYMLLGLFVLCSILFIIFAVLRKKITMIIFVLISFILLVITTVYKVQLNKDYALILQGEVLSIPEENSSLNIKLNSGYRVEVKGETKEWIFIEYENSTGWIKRENLLFI